MSSERIKRTEKGGNVDIIIKVNEESRNTKYSYLSLNGNKV